MNYYKAGSWNVICDVCGKKYKADQVKKRWDGLMVCKEDFEQRHPMDFLRTLPETAIPDFTRPESTDTFLEHYTYPDNIALADIGLADVAIVNDDLILNLDNGQIDAGSSLAGLAIAGSSTPNIN